MNLCHPSMTKLSFPLNNTDGVTGNLIWITEVDAIKVIHSRYYFIVIILWWSYICQMWYLEWCTSLWNYISVCFYKFVKNMMEYKRLCIQRIRLVKRPPSWESSIPPCNDAKLFFRYHALQILRPKVELPPGLDTNYKTFFTRRQVFW